MPKKTKTKTKTKKPALNVPYSDDYVYDPDCMWYADNGWQPLEFGFCPNKTAWDALMDAYKCSDEYPSGKDSNCAGKVTIFDTPKGRTCVLTIRDGSEHTASYISVLGLIAHESMHVWQQILEFMGEKSAGVEHEAYSMQHIFMGLLSLFMRTRGVHVKWHS